MTLWKQITFSVIVFIILLSGTLVFLVGTNSGLYLLFNAANRWVPGLEIGQITGGWRNLCLKNIIYQQSGVTINVEELYLALKLSCLGDGKIYVNNMSLKDVNVTVDSKKISSSIFIRKKSSHSLKFPVIYPITLYRLVLNNVNIKINDKTISVMNFSSGLRWQKNNLTLTPTLLKGVLIDLPKETNSEQKKIIKPKIQSLVLQGKPLGKKIKDLFSKPFLSEITEIYHLPLDLNIEEFKGEQLLLSGNINLVIFNILAKISSIDGNVKLDALDIETNQGSVTVIGNTLLHDNWPINITLNSFFNIDPLKRENIELKVSGALYDKIKLNINFSGPINMVLRGQVQLAEARLPFNLEIISKKVVWPFTDDKQLQVDDLKLKLSGKTTDYILFFSTLVKAHNVPIATIRLNAKGNERQINLDKLIITALEGKTELTALIDWQQVISWRGYLKLTDINIAKELPNWPSKLSGLIKTRGSLYGSSWQVDMPEIKLNGNIKQQNKVKINGSLKGNSYLQWVIPSLHVALGRNTVDIKGELGIKDINLDAAIDAANLNNVLLGLGGIVKGIVKVRGTVEAPQLVTNIMVSDLRWQDLFITNLKLNGSIKSTDQISGKLNVSIERIVKPGANIRIVTLTAKGSEKQHDLQLRIQGDPIFGQLHLIGSFDRQLEHWKGQLNDIRFSTPIGPLTSSSSIALDYRKVEKKVHIGPHCWINSNIELCVPQNINAGAKGHIVVNLNRFNLAMIKPFIPRSTKASGDFSGKATMEWDNINNIKEGLFKGSVTLSGHNVKVTQIFNETPLAISFDNFKINIGLYNNHIQIGWLIRLVDNGQFEGQVQINNPQKHRNLSGNINVRNFNLAIVNEILSRGENAMGLLNANLSLSGNVQSPQLFGHIRLNELNIDSHFMPFDMQPSQLTIHFNGTSSSLKGVIYTSHGQINLSGNANWSQSDNWRASVAVKGSSVRTILMPTVQLEISPDVIFEVTPGSFNLNGRVDVPWARIMILHDVSESAVEVSDDEILLNENLKPIEQKNGGIQINSHLTVHIGNNVQLDAFGLKTRLIGDLNLVQDKKGLGINGQINIPEGRFQAYGQDLIVRKGELLFSGPPDQPVLNIEAIRNPDTTEGNVIAGVRVTGSAYDPKAEIFSDPAMSQQEIFSYLLRGQGLDNDQSDNTVITSMLVRLGAAQSGRIIGKIGEIFGVSRMALDTQGSGDSSQVIISGYVLPDLQIKYGVGIFDSLATLTMRYRLMPKLYLEIMSGVDQSLNLLYQFDF